MVVGDLSIRCGRTRSQVKLYGADQDKLHKRMRGPHNTAAIGLDEVQDWESDVESFVDRVLVSTLTKEGRMFLEGTPGEQEGTFFHRVTAGEVGGWVPIIGAPLSNPHSRERVLGRLRKAKEANPDILTVPWARREYLGEWVPDDRKLEYRLTPQLNYRYSIPRHLHEWAYKMLIIDWGYFPDPCARVLAVASPAEIIFFAAEEQNEQKLADHVARLNTLKQEWGDDLIYVADPGGESKTLIVELQETHGFPIQAADKADKFTAIELWNRDASLGHIGVYNPEDPEHPENSPIAKNLNTLQWRFNKRTGKKEEGKPRHIADCCLYGWRWWKKYIATGEHVPYRRVDERTRMQRLEAELEASRERQVREGELPLWQRVRAAKGRFE